MDQKARSFKRLARWQSGHAEDCKSAGNVVESTLGYGAPRPQIPRCAPSLRPRHEGGV